MSPRPLADLASRVVALDRKSSAATTLVFTPDGVKFAAKSPAGEVTGRMEAQATLPDGEVRLRFNSLYLADAFSNMASDTADTRLAEKPTDRPRPIRIADARHPGIWNLVTPVLFGT